MNLEAAASADRIEGWSSKTALTADLIAYVALSGAVFDLYTSRLQPEVADLAPLLAGLVMSGALDLASGYLDLWQQDIRNSSE